MGQFRYRAVDNRSRPFEGALDAESAREVVQHLERQGLQATAVEPVDTGPTPFPHKLRLTSHDLDLFNEQLLAIVRSGMPLAPSLAMLAEDVTSRRLRRVLEDVRHQVESGRSLSEALDRHPKSFSPVYRSLIRAGEKSGNLAHALALLSTDATQQAEFRARVQEAVAYPALVVGAAVFLLILFLGRTAPSIQLDFTLAGRPLPPTTQLILNTSAMLHAYWLQVVGAAVLMAVVLALGWKLLARSHGGRRFRDRLRMRLPLLGPLFRDASLTRFTRSASMLLAGRVPLSDTLRLAGAASGNSLLEDAALDAADRVETGQSLSDSLAAQSFFRSTFCWIIRVGEERNRLEESLKELAEACGRAAEDRTRHVARILGPMLTIAAAVFVGLVVLAVYQPFIASIF
jgi:type II secretory pathway component PulF